VHQAASACHDYFKWGDFLTGNGNDHAEGGYLDRGYFALALACSTGILNEVPNSYAAHWGMPAEISRRRQALANAYGDSAWAPYGMVQNMEHRDVDVLMLYPIDLVATEERFGNWMTQYGYANYVTPAKLLERGKTVNGAVEMAGRRFTTLVTLFEPFPSPKVLEMMRQLAESGGRVVWSGPPPVLADDGSPALAAWKDLFGVDYPPTPAEGIMVPGKQVVFEGKLAGLTPMAVLTEMLPDHVYPVTPRAGAQPVARVKKWCVGTHKPLEKGGSLTFLGFRPRDDQSGSLGYETRYWFDILSALGAYPASGRFAGVNDNTEHLSRTTSHLVCRFPNGTIAIAPHLRDVDECWPGGWARNREEDEKIVKGLTLPSEHISLKDLKVHGQAVSFEGQQCIAFRADADGRLTAFCRCRLQPDHDQRQDNGLRRKADAAVGLGPDRTRLPNTGRGDAADPRSRRGYRSHPGPRPAASGPGHRRRPETRQSRRGRYRNGRRRCTGDDPRTGTNESVALCGPRRGQFTVREVGAVSDRDSPDG